MRSLPTLNDHHVVSLAQRLARVFIVQIRDLSRREEEVEGGCRLDLQALLLHALELLHALFLVGGEAKVVLARRAQRAC